MTDIHYLSLVDLSAKLRDRELSCAEVTGHMLARIDTLDSMLDLDFDTAIPGHGDVMTRSDVEAFRDQFVLVRERMQELIASGMEKDEAATRIVTDTLSWTTATDGLFMRRSIPGFFDEIAAEESDAQ